MPPFTADFFWSRYMGGIYGWILLAWGAAAIPSPILIAWVRQTTGSYQMAIHVINIVMLVSLLLPLLARRPQGRAESAPVWPENWIRLNSHGLSRSQADPDDNEQTRCQGPWTHFGLC